MTGKVGLIFGSGYGTLRVDKLSEVCVDTPYGSPSSNLMEFAFGETSVVGIARHGERHTIAPHEVNYRANIWALREADARQVIGINVVGAIVECFVPADIGIPSQIIDYTSGRDSSFVVPGETIRHIDFTQPFDNSLRLCLVAAAEGCGSSVHQGVYGVTNGPRLETAAEIDRMERDGCAMVGMTAMPEACLARELGMAYAICAVAVNYAAGRSPNEIPIHEELLQNLDLGMGRVAQVLHRVIPDLQATM